MYLGTSLRCTSLHNGLSSQYEKIHYKWASAPHCWLLTAIIIHSCDVTGKLEVDRKIPQVQQHVWESPARESAWLQIRNSAQLRRINLHLCLSLYELERTNADPEASLIQVHVNWPLLPLCCAVVPEQYSRERCECQPIRKLIVPFPRVNCSQSKKEFVWKWVNALTYFHTQYILAE